MRNLLFLLIFICCNLNCTKITKNTKEILNEETVWKIDQLKINLNAVDSSYESIYENFGLLSLRKDNTGKLEIYFPGKEETIEFQYEIKNDTLLNFTYGSEIIQYRTYWNEHVLKLVSQETNSNFRYTLQLLKHGFND